MQKLCGVASLQVETATGETFAKNASAIFMETSAKDGSNVQELFRTIGEIYGEELSDLCVWVYQLYHNTAVYGLCLLPVYMYRAITRYAIIIG